MSALKIAFIGTGNMAGAIIRGLVKTQTGQVEMGLYDLDTEKSAALAAETEAMVAEDAAAAVLFGDVIVLAVKPQGVAGLLKEIAPVLAEAEGHKVVVSVAAGVELAVYEQALPGVAVCRAMPNTSCAVLAAITGLMAGQHLQAEDKAKVEQIFQAVGKTLWIPEEEIHALIAVSGSGPAYFYYFTEQMAKAGERLGLSPEVAAALARQTAVGAGKMLAEKTESAETLRLQVTSPNGTTAEAIAAFEKELPEVVYHAMAACAKRSEELAKA